MILIFEYVWLILFAFNFVFLLGINVLIFFNFSLFNVFSFDFLWLLSYLVLILYLEFVNIISLLGIYWQFIIFPLCESLFLLFLLPSFLICFPKVSSFKIFPFEIFISDLVLNNLISLTSLFPLLSSDILILFILSFILFSNSFLIEISFIFWFSFKFSVTFTELLIFLLSTLFIILLLFLLIKDFVDIFFLE